ncbi:MAG: C_GCAxxG_C_C family protein [Candidatus Lokiarchaeota archaeon]|nr:C_GCAxxG_C_C family protein [Candidatus Lokiarchaeota archaeon]
MDNVTIAINYLKKGFNSTQAVLATYCKKYNLDLILAMKIATGFECGMANKAQICGAIMGAFMVLGLEYGRFKEEDTEAKEKTLFKINEFKKKFVEINGTIECKKLLDCDINTKKGLEVAKNKDYFDLKCPKYIRDTVKILDTFL